jgi:hypothetical protein
VSLGPLRLRLGLSSMGLGGIVLGAGGDIVPMAGIALGAGIGGAGVGVGGARRRPLSAAGSRRYSSRRGSGEIGGQIRICPFRPCNVGA